MRRGFGFFLAAAILISGCSKAPIRPVTPPTAEHWETVTLTIGYQSRIDTALDILIGAFQDQNPEVRIEKRQISTYDEQIKAVANGAVDLIAATLWEPKVAERQLVALDPEVAKARLDMAAYGDFSGGMQANGHLYGLPVLRMPLVLVADKGRFQAAGLQVPERCWTWDEFRATARKLTDPLGKQKVWGYQFALPYLLTDLWMTDQSGRPYWKAPATAAYAPFRFFMTMAQTDGSLSPQLLPSGGSLYGEMTGSDPKPAGLRVLQDGTAAMTEEFWRPELAQQAVVLPTPCVNPAKPVMSSVSTWVGIAAASKRPDAAWRFVNFAAGPEGAGLLARAGELPAYMSEAVAADWSSRHPAAPKVTALFFDSKWFEEPLDSEAAIARGKVMQLFIWALKEGRPSEDAYAQYLKLR